MDGINLDQYRRLQEAYTNHLNTALQAKDRPKTHLFSGQEGYQEVQDKWDLMKIEYLKEELAKVGLTVVEL